MPVPEVVWKIRNEVNATPHERVVIRHKIPAKLGRQLGAALPPTTGKTVGPAPLGAKASFATLVQGITTS